MTPKDFKMKVLGRTLEHLGVQMYKRRDVAIAELVANSWDAGANDVWVSISEENLYDQNKSLISIEDNGKGMDADQVQNEYLVVGRNRRQNSAQEISPIPPMEGDENEGMSQASEARPVMGRKGIGKLAGFGLAKQMHLITWKKNQSVEINLDIDALKLDDREAKDVSIPGSLGSLSGDVKSASGTKVTLSILKHSTPIDLASLRESLARRFSRRVRGRMNIFVNDELLGDPQLSFEKPPGDMIIETLPDGNRVKYCYGFHNGTIRSAELRGFTIYVRGKTAQAPPFYFQVEGTASGQHATKYLYGEIEADFIDEGNDDDSDLVATDRQEIDWENEKVFAFKTWGQELTRRLFREWADRGGSRVEAWILSDEQLSDRIGKFEKNTQKQVKEFLRKLGGTESTKERALELASSLIRAYEYQHFIDVIEEIEAAAEDPIALQDLLSYLSEWNVLESRAILEIIKGRLAIIEKFHSLIVNDAPETASSKSLDNLHDLLAGQPWLLNPEWQVLYEEKSITKQLREWGYSGVSEEEKQRYDFLGLAGDGKIVVIEIKRPGHPVAFSELTRLEEYRNKLSQAHTDDLYMVMIHGGGLDASVSSKTKKNWEQRDDGEMIEWKDVHSKTRDYYEHYRAVLEGNVSHPNFSKKQKEIRQTRKIIESGSVHRDRAERKKGLGSQDSDYTDKASQVIKDALEKKREG